MPIYMTRPPNRKTVADSDEHAAELEQLGFVRDVVPEADPKLAPKKRAPRKTAAAKES